MADFCHDCEPGGVGCGGKGPEHCPDPCYGDFAGMVERVVAAGPGYFDHHICEGCGAYFVVAVGSDGKPRTWHAPIAPDQTIEDLFACEDGPGWDWLPVADPEASA